MPRSSRYFHGSRHSSLTPCVLNHIGPKFAQNLALNRHIPKGMIFFIFPHFGPHAEKECPAGLSSAELKRCLAAI